jgi:hypothetical protein
MISVICLLRSDENLPPRASREEGSPALPALLGTHWVSVGTRVDTAEARRPEAEHRTATDLQQTPR